MIGTSPKYFLKFSKKLGRVIWSLSFRKLNFWIQVQRWGLTHFSTAQNPKKKTQGNFSGVNLKSERGNVMCLSSRQKPEKSPKETGNGVLEKGGWVFSALFASVPPKEGERGGGSEADLSRHSWGGEKRFCGWGVKFIARLGFARSQDLTRIACKFLAVFEKK